MTRDNTNAMNNYIIFLCFLQLIAFLKIHGLREEGLLRIPGSQQRIKVGTILLSTVRPYVSITEFMYVDAIERIRF